MLRRRTPVLAALVVLAACSAPTNDEDFGAAQKEAIPPEKRAEWQADLDRFASARSLWDRNQPDGPFEPAGRYLFGKWRYRLDLYRRGEELALVSWGIDYGDVDDGSAWLAIGHGRREGDVADVMWSCINLSLSYSQAGGARIVFSDHDRRLRVEYHHDTQPLHLQWGTAVEVDADDRRRVEANLIANEDLALGHLSRPGVITIRGTVLAGGRPLPGAAVFQRGKPAVRAVSGTDGAFEFELSNPRENILLACAAPGHHNAASWVRPDAPIARFDLRPLPEADDPDYRFLAAAPDETDLFRCANCHDGHYDQWRGTAHATSGSSALYRSMVAGAKPDDCRPCHEPARHLEGAAPDATDDRTAGIGCDVCHKIVDVHPEAPPAGRLSVLRPDPDDGSRPGPVKVVFGPLADVTYHYMGASYAPLYSRGNYCGACHELATPGGVPIDTTWSEWRAWAGAVEQPKSCQDCHMPAVVNLRQIARYQLRRPPSQIRNHAFPLSAEGPEADALPLELTARPVGGVLEVVAAVDNPAGHSVPAGKAGRTIHLVVTATDARGRSLARVAGPVLGPEAGLAGDDATLDDRLWEGALAGLPGRAFSRRLEMAGDRPVGLLADERIPAGGRATLEVAFDLTGVEGEVRLSAHLLDRPTNHARWAALADPGPDPLDRVLAEKTETLTIR